MRSSNAGNLEAIHIPHTCRLPKRSAVLWFLVPHVRCILFSTYRNNFLLKKLSNLQSFRLIRALIASQSTFYVNKMMNSLINLFSYFLKLLFVSHFTQSLQCFDSLFFRNRFVKVQYLFKTIKICSKCKDEKKTITLF